MLITNGAFIERKVMTPPSPSMEELSASLTQLLQSQQSFQLNFSASINNLKTEIHHLRSLIPPPNSSSPITPHRPNNQQHPTPNSNWYSLASLKKQPKKLHPYESMGYIDPNPKPVAENIEEILDLGRKQIEQPNLIKKQDEETESLGENSPSEPASIFGQTPTPPPLLRPPNVVSSMSPLPKTPLIPPNIVSSYHPPLVKHSWVVTTRPISLPCWFTGARELDNHDSQAEAMEMQIKVFEFIGNNFICSLDLVDIGPLIIDPGGLLKVACTVAMEEIPSLSPKFLFLIFDFGHGSFKFYHAGSVSLEISYVWLGCRVPTSILGCCRNTPPPLKIPWDRGKLSNVILVTHHLFVKIPLSAMSTFYSNTIWFHDLDIVSTLLKSCYFQVDYFLISYIVSNCCTLESLYWGIIELRSAHFERRNQSYRQWESLTFKFSRAANVSFFVLQMPQILRHMRNPMSRIKIILLYFLSYGSECLLVV